MRTVVVRQQNPPQSRTGVCTWNVKCVQPQVTVTSDGFPSSRCNHVSTLACSNLLAVVPVEQRTTTHLAVSADANAPIRLLPINSEDTCLVYTPRDDNYVVTTAVPQQNFLLNRRCLPPDIVPSHEKGPKLRPVATRSPCGRLYRPLCILMECLFSDE